MQFCHIEISIDFELEMYCNNFLTLMTYFLLWNTNDNL